MMRRVLRRRRPPDESATMPVVEHLEELRRRLIAVVVAVFAGAIAAFAASDPIVALLRRPLPEGYDVLFFTSLGEPLAIRLKIAFFGGVVIAMPVILYNLWRFVTPGLTPGERRIVWPFLGLAVVLFAVGVAVGYVVIPFAVGFLLELAVAGTEPLLTLGEYVGFVTTMLIVFGLVLEFPVVILALARVGILSHAYLARRRRWALLAFVVFAVVATPGGDPLSPIILSATMYVLFELTLFAIRLMRR
jgi:sec-independent protein translocase protein TatC